MQSTHTAFWSRFTSIENPLRFSFFLKTILVFLYNIDIDGFYKVSAKTKIAPSGN